MDFVVGWSESLSELKEFELHFVYFGVEVVKIKHVSKLSHISGADPELLLGGGANP